MPSKRRTRLDRLAAHVEPLGKPSATELSPGEWLYQVRCDECYIERPTDRFPGRKWKITTRGRPMPEILGFWLVHLADKHPEEMRGRKISDLLEVPAAEL